MQTAYRVWSEFDLGLEHTVFATYEDAEQLAKSAYEYEATPGEDSFDNILGDLIQIKKVVLVGYFPPPVKGYKGLQEWQLEQMNQIKETGKALGGLVEHLRSNPELDQRWISIGATNLQQGLMALTRAVAKPDFF